MPEIFQLQNCVDWNIKQRDGQRVEVLRTFGDGFTLASAEHRRHVRRHQRNIDALNAQILEKQS